MIFADKLIMLRKKNGWSQEELAEKLNVTRQSVSKWEGAQSIPDLDKMLGLSNIFGVTLDYLIKDEIEETECLEEEPNTTTARKVSMEEANAFLNVKKETSTSIALATFLCVISPICLIILGVLTESPKYNISDGLALGIGMITMIVLIVIAVVIFILSGQKTEKYQYLDKELVDTAYGVKGMVMQCKENYNTTYTRNNIIGTCLCISAIIPLFVGAMINENDDLLLVLMLCIGIFLVAIGVIFFVKSGIIHASHQKLLQEGDYSVNKKQKSSVISAISTVYWLLATAVFLIYSFSTNNWDTSWIIWIAAGVIFPAIITIVKLFVKDND